MSLVEDFFDLLERALCGLGEAEDEVDGSSKVECSENEVRLPRNVRQRRRDRPRERKVERPVGGRCERDGLATDAHGEDFGGVRPRDGAHRDSERADEQVRANDDALGDRLVAGDQPDG